MGECEMATAKSRAISAILIISMVIGMVGIFNTDTTYAAKKKIHLKKTKVTLVVGKQYQQKPGKNVTPAFCINCQSNGKYCKKGLHFITAGIIGISDQKRGKSSKTGPCHCNKVIIKLLAQQPQDRNQKTAA